MDLIKKFLLFVLRMCNYQQCVLSVAEGEVAGLYDNAYYVRLGIHLFDPCQKKSDKKMWSNKTVCITISSI